MLLKGLKVIEYATYIAAPGAGGLMADWGADVIKIEPPGGDPIRRFFDTIGSDIAENPVFDLDNRGKRSIIIDTAQNEGRELVRKLVQEADVFITNVRPGGLTRAGLDYAALSAVNPRLIYAKSCDIAKSFLAKSGVSYSKVDAPAGTVASIKIGSETLVAPDPNLVAGAEKKAAITAYQDSVKAALAKAGYPSKAEPATMNKPMVIAILVYLVLLVTAVYGPIAALLVEIFPSRIRYTSMSLPYHVGNGWFGGFLPTTAFAMVAATGDIYYGLWYPVLIAGLTAVVGLFFLPETFKRRLDE